MKDVVKIEITKFLIQCNGMRRANEVLIVFSYLTQSKRLLQDVSRHSESLMRVK